MYEYPYSVQIGGGCSVQMRDGRGAAGEEGGLRATKLHRGHLKRNSALSLSDPMGGFVARLWLIAMPGLFYPLPPRLN